MGYGHIRGITVTLYEKTQAGVDEFNKPIYTEAPVSVDNVIVAPVSTTEVVDTLSLTGRRAVYQLAIPKGDTHDWEDRKVDFFDKSWRTIGLPTEGIEAMIPLGWNKKVQVERYE